MRRRTSIPVVAVGVGVAALLIGSLASPAAGADGAFAGTSKVYDGTRLVGEFTPDDWGVIPVDRGIHAWWDPDVRWSRRNTGEQVKWNTRIYCHKANIGVYGEEVLVTADIPLAPVVTRGPSTSSSGETSGNSNVGIIEDLEEYYLLVSTKCTVVRLNFKPYVFSGGQWHAGETLRDYIRIAPAR